MLIEKLKEYATQNTYPMHMPGHKRQTGHLADCLPHGIDITEIHGFDDLHNPSGILLETAELAAKNYGSKKAYPLINGSTAGILSAIGAHTTRGDKILIAKNCHWSVDNAAALFGLSPKYITPKNDGPSGVPIDVAPSEIEEALNTDPDIKLVVITSPSYEGVVSDVSSIAQLAHSKNIPLFVDSAHGAHLGFSGMFPKSAIQAGADIAVMSLHKTLPALTQCSLLHLCTGRANAEETQRMLSILQTSSPSYVLMASIDSCMHTLNRDHAHLFCEYEKKLIHFGESIKKLEKLTVLYHTRNISSTFYGFDPGKIVIVAKNTSLSGVRLMEILRQEYNIELEKACNDYAIAMTSICDSTEGFDRLAKALVEIDCKIV